ncbi:hypothetical protein CKF54_08040 [Psittacicella hinzii]|uniref:TNase-like domain-containing protein n=1 Tax=Psittacicella hinzii TaxID=2028575 RepID=A0A3A1XYH8_9GAMM|nr:thermonuclease family protein [Psittacicella hinzii]RIY31033.1 hypothetical protein CKF54_08040 [Psittacicella hinzii]
MRKLIYFLSIIVTAGIAWFGTEGSVSKANSSSPVRISTISQLPLSESSSVISASSVDNLRLTSCQVSSVYDGDTFHCRVGNQTIKVRLLGIDAPEVKQTYGQESASFLRSLVVGKTIKLFTTGTDRYKRYLGNAFLPQGNGYLNVNQYLLEKGQVWFYRYSNKNTELYTVYGRVESKARNGKVGLWNPSLYSNGRPVEPKTWRDSSKR